MKYMFFIPKSQQYLRKALLSNLSPLFEMKVCGKSNLVTMFYQTNLFTSWSWMLERGSTLTHFVK